MRGGKAGSTKRGAFFGRWWLVLLTLGGLSAQDVVLLDPEEAADRAIARSSDLVAASRDEAAVAAAQAGAWSFARPQLSARAGADRRYVLEDRSEPAFLAGLALEQHVYTPGRWDAVAAGGRARQEAARADLDVVRRDAALRARLAVERVRLAKARLSVLRERKQQREEEEADALALFAAGRTTITETRQAAIATAQAADAVLAGEADLAATMRELAAAVEADGPVDARGALTRPDGLAVLLAQAREARGAELRALAARKQAEISQGDLRATGGYPQLFVVADTTTRGDRYDRTYADWGVGASLRWSLYDGGARLADDEASRAREAALAARARATDRERSRLLATLADELPILAGRLDLATSSIEAAVLNYADVRELYRLGRLRLINVGEAGLAVQDWGLVRAQLIAREAEIAHRLRALAE